MFTKKMIPANFFGLNDWFDTLNEDVKACDSYVPRATVSEKGGIYTLEVELPGVKKSDIDVDIEGDTLTIKATRKSATSEMKYERSFKLSEDLNAENADAFLEDGILTFKFVKKQSAQAHKLVIK
ncbi:MAG: Hsp20/alpha crystallin family protein [Hallerella porci]|uniref:HSP20 family protein n=1 Tax=Hallerella porci TaxID=1945871 RepID=A0ABX5LL12_9BACT|nr:MULTISPECIES: Hsp20/alpha crystallin family protein [Hallerella]MCI5600725.1 Hsp20/alpha crystallin family protein [Hallerella sp.]MDY3922014.1 Hsp20/alpha crystallin family protein [Hallerella porci]PWL01172.1 HSP20 family protein [Hallerella porci]